MRAVLAVSIITMMATYGYVNQPEEEVKVAVKKAPSIQHKKKTKPVPKPSTDYRYAVIEDSNFKKAKYHRIAEKIFDNYNLPLGLATVMLRYESKTGDLMVSKTGCLGFYQFCKKTAKAYKLKKPMDIHKSSDAAARLMRDNKVQLKKKGVYPSRFNLYLAHMIGASGTSYLNKALDGDKLTRKQVRTLKRVIKPNWTKSMGSFNKLSLRDIASKFYDHVDHNFERFEPNYTRI